MDLLSREILLVDKPAGLSSFAVVARVRRIYTEQVRADALHKNQTPPRRAKVGHAGTLDPFATGLLICLLGKGTKKATEFLKLDKKYQATICLGKTSTTGDIEGEISETNFSGIPEATQVQKVVESFRGEIEQKVPAYSAVKINGKRAYELARKGIAAEMPVRKVQIYDISIIDYAWPYLKIACHVSSGTYIRTLGEDIGKKLGIGGYLTELRRTQIGKYKISDAITLAELGITD